MNTLRKGQKIIRFEDGDETITVKTQELFSGEYLAWDIDRPLLASGRGFSTIGAIASLFAKLPAAASEREERDDQAARFDHARDYLKHGETV